MILIPYSYVLEQLKNLLNRLALFVFIDDGLSCMLELFFLEFSNKYPVLTFSNFVVVMYKYNFLASLR